MTSHVFPRWREVRSVDPAIARRGLAVFVAAHGLAHLVGTTHAFSRAADGASLSYLGGSWTVSDPTTLRAVGVVWAAIALAFLATGAVIWAGRSWWPVVLWWVSLASLLLVVIAVWASIVGVLVDLGLLAVAWHAGAFSRHQRRA